MIARASQLFLPTLREAPADAEALSHKLLVRGGFIRQVSTGLWTFMPLGWRVHRKVEQIIREELHEIGAQEWFAPVLTPLELWEATGRAGIPELFHEIDKWIADGMHRPKRLKMAKPAALAMAEMSEIPLESPAPAPVN